MASHQDAPRPSANFPDPARLADAWTQLFANSVAAMQATADRGAAAPAPVPFDPQAPVRAFAEFAADLWSNPTKLWDAQRAMLGEWTTLWTNGLAATMGGAPEPLVAPARGDRRFNDPAWREPAFDLLKQAYLLTTRQTLDLVANSDLDPATRVRVDFFARQFLSALSPANFALTNPEAIAKALESGGVSLVSGLANMIEDAASPGGLVRRRSADDFELGVSLAVTPGGVVFQNEMMQLLQYTPTTGEVYRRPLLYIPPLVNKYYVLDLQPKSSMVKWLVDQGHTVFVVSWVNPGVELAEKGVADYIIEGPVAALEAIERATGERTVDMFGFCMGGTLVAMAAAYLAGKGQGDRLGSITTIGTLLEFSDTGEWATFYEPSHMAAFEKHVRATGVIGAEKLQALFSLVRSNDLIWSSVVNHYLLDKIAPASDLLYWFADGARIPAAFLLEYGEWLLRGNRLKDAGGIVIDGVGLDLGQVATPACVISLKEDHVSGWAATYHGAKLLGGPTTFMLGGSGHNAGLVNPPAANKHGYWINAALPATADEWLAGAETQGGSWWPAWQAWLTRDDAAKVAARTPGDGDLPVLEAAPGSYVRAS